MDSSIPSLLRIGAWRVDAAAGSMTRADEIVRLEPRTLRLLLCLAERAGELVASDELLERVWPGVIVTPDSVYQAVASLRRLLGDNPKQPEYIVTVPRQGYRMIAAVAPWDDGSGAAAVPPRDAPVAALAAHAPRRRMLPLIAGAVLLALAAIIVYAKVSSERTAPMHAAAPQPASVAVLPFLDLTEEMAEEYFADGMTEELIDKLSQIPGAHVPSATAAFFFKGKQMTPAAIAAQLNVAYVLDGSVRKSGSTVRVAARLVHADDGFVLWSESYDRDIGDLIMVQDDIAGEVRKALTARIEAAAQQTH